MVQKTILDCGLVVLTEHQPQSHSLALSYSLRGGARAETRETNGIHHLVEHMMFKGTERRDLRQIADISDRLGGRLNAFTGKEMTQYYIKAIDNKLADSFDLLSDIVLNSSFPTGEFEKERNVVIQEIKESEDNPETDAFEIFYDKMFTGNPLGYPIAGQIDQVFSFTRGQVLDFYRDRYKPGNLILAGVGAIRHDQLVGLARKIFKGYPAGIPGEMSFETPQYHFGNIKKNKSALQQIYVLMAFKGITLKTSYRYPFLIMNDILGSGMSSRLFQRIREEKGLAYTISSFCEGFWDCGLHFIYSVIEPGKVNEYLDEVFREISRLKKDGIRTEELTRGKDHLNSTLVLGLENIVSKMRYNINQDLYLGYEIPVEEVMRIIEQTKEEEVNDLLAKYLDLDEMLILGYGNLRKCRLKGRSFRSV